LIAAASTIRDALDGAVTAIAAAGCESPRLDAELLLAHALGVGRERLLLDRDLAVQGATVRVFREHVRRRAVEREPVAYIVGTRHFRRLELRVDRRALIPRPETELLVEVGLALPAGARVLDVGTGSGAVALALKQERPDLAVLGSDIGEQALALARENAQLLGLDVPLLRGDLLDLDIPPLDAVLANLPYVPAKERAALPPEIARHEPASALFAGEDGLTAIRRLASQAGASPTPALLALEVGAGQAPAVRELVETAGFRRCRAERDLAGVERVVIGEREAAP
jgi:release factor glutamine methyltransferase